MKKSTRITAFILFINIILSVLPFYAAAEGKLISSCEISISQASFTYTGSRITPDITVQDGETVLTEYLDYTKEYFNNIDIGTASVTIYGIGEYSGSQTIQFNIVLGAPVELISTAAAQTSITLGWSSVTGAYGYEIEKYNASKNTFIKLVDVSTAAYTDKGLKKVTAYRYRIRAYAITGGVRIYGGYSSQLCAYTIPKAPVLTLSTGNKKVKTSWKKNSTADGYEIYRAKNIGYIYDWESGEFIFSGDFKRIKTLSNKISFVNKKLKNKTAYYYKVRAYKIISGVKVYSEFSNTLCSTDANSRLNYAKLKSRKSIKMVSARSDVKSCKISISKSDRKIMKKFAKKHFKMGMTRAEKVEYLLSYIHNKTNYIKTSSQWNKISGKSYVYDIFKLHLGQCAQYNGALAMFLAYLGYDARLVCGYRGTASNKWSHYWCEIKIDSVTYLMEAGNKKDGAWGFNCVLYSEADGKYIKNGKNC